MVLALEHKPEKALRELRRGLAMLPDDDRSEVRQRILMRAAQLTEMHLSDVHLPEALRYYRTVAEEYRGLPAAYEAGVRIAELLRNRLHDTVHAEEQFLAVAEAFRNQPGIELMLLKAGEAAVDGERLDAARRHAQGLLDGHPDSRLVPEALAMLADVNRRAGHLTEAVDQFLTLSQRLAGTPEGARALARAGDCLAEQGDFAHAIARYIESLPLHPDPMAVQRSLDRARKRFQLMRPSPAAVRAWAARDVGAGESTPAAEAALLPDAPGGAGTAEPAATGADDAPN